MNKGEGKNLTASYSWFKDQDVINDFVGAVNEISESLPDKVEILSIGSGVGTLEIEVKRSLEQKFHRQVVLTLTDRDIKDTTSKSDIRVLKADNKDLPFQDKTFDLILARSVTHYEKNIESETRVLDEINRVMRDEGFFITEAPFLAGTEEAALLHEIHSSVSKFMNLKTHQELLDIHKNVFKVVEVAAHQPGKPLSVAKDNFIKRYEISDEKADEIADLIRGHDSKQIPNVWINGNDFGWSVNYAILICSK